MYIGLGLRTVIVPDGRQMTASGIVSTANKDLVPGIKSRT